MEFEVLVPRRRSGRESLVMEAAFKVAESLGARLVVERGNVRGTSVYIKKGRGRFMVYEDLDKNLSQSEVRIHIIHSIISSYVHGHVHQTCTITMEGGEIVAGRS
jgi:hypothetical protein